jgi:aspartate racemase
MNKNNQTIGIIGGMGPQASAKLLETIIGLSAKEYGAKKDLDFPNIILNSVAVPDFISNKKNINEVLGVLTKVTARLEIFSPKCFGIACNTAHILLPSLQKITNIPFVSIIEEVAKTVKTNRIETVGLMATPVTIHSQLYQKALKKQGVKIIIPTLRERTTTDAVVRHVLAGKIKESDRKKLIEISESLRVRGAEGIILGCTELPLIFPKDFSFPIFDSIKILSEALLRKYYK